MFNDSQEELKRLLQLLKLEKDNDYDHYRHFIEKASVQERRAQGLSWFPVIIKDTGYGLGDYPFLVAERPRGKDGPHHFSAGKSVSVFNMQPGGEGEQARGTVHFVSGNTMKVILQANDHPDWLDGGKIGINLLFDDRSYAEMEKAVKAVMQADRNRLAELREILLGYRKAEYNYPLTEIKLPQLNDSQNAAITDILGARDVAVIHGPPGTGKTTTLVQAIKLLAEDKKPVLVCAPSNAAADLLTEKLSDAGLDVVRIGNISRVDDKVMSHTIDSRLENHPEAKSIKKLKRQSAEYRSMALKYKRHFGKAEREQRKLLLKEAKAVSADAVAMEDAMIQRVLNNADAITCTLVGAANRYLEGRTYHTVVIDEAGQALEPACWIPIAKAEKVVLAGDPLQLPPTVRSDEAMRQGLSVTLLEKCVERQTRVSLLDTQYRMNAQIMGFSNSWFYGDKLKAHEQVAQAVLHQDTGSPLIFIDTAGCSFDEKMSPESKSYFNPGEGDILQKHLEELLALLPPGQEISLGIISPYREQVRYLEERFKGRFSQQGLTLDIDTIDSFQGQERDAIYISMVRSNERGEIGFLRDYRRMNVAMTRARKKLVIIGDSATIGQDKFYDRFLQYADAAGGYGSAWAYM